mmetsp:Transcript_42083/g.127662  ORF Transcript_42083/g.127662 Transcript_42083/m.127662 type:complete len:209 (-) Transcript_42083:593-1219(-)
MMVVTEETTRTAEAAAARRPSPRTPPRRMNPSRRNPSYRRERSSSNPSSTSPTRDRPPGAPTRPSSFTFPVREVRLSRISWVSASARPWRPRSVCATGTGPIPPSTSSRSRTTSTSTSTPRPSTAYSARRASAWPNRSSRISSRRPTSRRREPSSTSVIRAAPSSSSAIPWRGPFRCTTTAPAARRPISTPPSRSRISPRGTASRTTG